MYNRENRRPRINKSTGKRDENRFNREYTSGTREGNERGYRDSAYEDRPARRRVVVRDLQQERAGRFENDERRVRTDRFKDRRDREERNFSGSRNKGDRNDTRGKRENNREGRSNYSERPARKRFVSGEKSEKQKNNGSDSHVYSQKKQLTHRLKNDAETELRLNRFIAKGGVCSRRDADALILAGRVKVNGEVIQQVGVKVKRTDRVEVDDKEILPEKKVYIILNKPKDYVTTMDDPLERKTVMSLIEGACEERVYPIGRLDRQTTGVLLFTNDGDLAKKLTHPKYNQKKIYHVFLDKVIRPGDIKAIAEGIELEDGFVQADDIQVNLDDKTQVGIEIHSGKNRIVRRIFEHLGYQILRLDRVFFAGLTKKNLPRGHWRFLTPEEVNILKTY